MTHESELSASQVTTVPPQIGGLHQIEMAETMTYLPSDLDSTMMREIEIVVGLLASGSYVLTPRGGVCSHGEAIRWRAGNWSQTAGALNKLAASTREEGS